MILDTHVLIWLDCDDPTLGPAARAAVLAEWRAGRVAVSAITFWEVAMLVDRARLQLPHTPAAWRARWLAAGLTEIPLDGRIAVAATQLNDFHRDPADRFILATANDLAQPLLTADRQLLAWRGPGERLDATR
ncbi:MAG: type II toxin-antitoxin system VapC family toxin [Casimicrobiaceae bacterium]|nr:type II toxin-antitoxin system VapC family toxin [Casimicrobiaceae bacterium]MCX8097974.1 type II toxin-antitoxin system VapC family toxin [Casimicrobiaceae bacterium]MDW8312666.1 type II toxin-antitoxin system VapC family toxin [Burkholderiales bacterium]